MTEEKLPVEKVTEVFEELCRSIEKEFGWTPGRLYVVKVDPDCGLPGRTLISIEGNPKLTPEEDDIVGQVFMEFGKSQGANPILGGQA
jgi:hypothetical protein